MIGTGALGWAFERIIIRPVYGQHLKQILITTGGLIVAEQLIHVVWGGDQKAMALPPGLRGAILFGDVALEKFRLLAVDRRPGCLCGDGAGAEPHQDRPADPRRRREPGNGRGARLPRSAACSSACSSRARRWPVSAA